jgi:hypothetical protein
VSVIWLAIHVGKRPASLSHGSSCLLNLWPAGRRDNICREATHEEMGSRSGSKSMWVLRQRYSKPTLHSLVRFSAIVYFTLIGTPYSNYCWIMFNCCYIFFRQTNHYSAKPMLCMHFFFGSDQTSRRPKTGWHTANLDLPVSKTLWWMNICFLPCPCFLLDEFVALSSFLWWRVYLALDVICRGTASHSPYSKGNKQQDKSSRVTMMQ